MFAGPDGVAVWGSKASRGWRAQAIQREAEVTGPPVAMVAFVVYALFTLSHAFLLAGSARLVMTLAAGTTAVTLLALTSLKRAGRLTGRRLLTTVLALASINSVLHLAITGQAQHSTNVIIVLMALGFFVLEPRRMALFGALLVAAWVLVMPRDSGLYVHYGFAVGSSLVLAATMGEIRRRTIFRLTSRSQALRRSQKELEANFKIIQAQEQEAQLITDTVSDLLVRLSAEGKVMFANEAAKDVLGVSPDQLRGQECRRLVAPVSHPDFDAFIEQAHSGSASCEVRCVDANGNRRWIEMRGAPLPDGSLLLVCRDVEARHQAEKMKDHLIATAGHELRTPMTSIHGALALMQDADDATRQVLLDTALESSDRMIRLVNQTLDLERITRMEGLDFAPTNSMSIVEEAVKGIQGHPLAARCNVTIVGDDATFVADRDKLIQVIINLLGNALRYTPEGGSVEVGTRPTTRHVEFWVHDEGLGVPPEARDRIFKAFEQVEDIKERHDGTTGLGLTISKAMVEAQAGTLWLAESAKGAHFHFRIPKVQEESP